MRAVVDGAEWTQGDRNSAGPPYLRIRQGIRGLLTGAPLDYLRDRSGWTA
ncbi:predicted protein [Streptomyces sp. C]|nr:predicted protein [Streptomyces sp. C]